MISVVIPIYNVEKYIDKCINSVLNQSYRNLEIILVDDGSPDRCGEICDNYAKNDARIKVIHKENGGLSDARNKGIECANGKYIAFIDSDDFIHPQMFEILYHNIVLEDADISVCNFLEVQDGDDTTVPYLNIRNIDREVYIGSYIMEQLEYHNISTVVAWNKIYRMELFQEIRYPKGKLHEDEFVIHRILHCCRKSVYTTEKLYYYLQRKGSITDTVKWNVVADGIDAYFDRVKFLSQHGYVKINTLTKLQVLHYITKYYQRLSNVKEASTLLKIFYDTFLDYYSCEDVQNCLDNEKKDIYKHFVKNPQSYYKRLEQLEKRKQRLMLFKRSIKK